MRGGGGGGGGGSGPPGPPPPPASALGILGSVSYKTTSALNHVMEVVPREIIHTQSGLQGSEIFEEDGYNLSIKKRHTQLSYSGPYRLIGSGSSEQYFKPLIILLYLC